MITTLLIIDNSETERRKYFHYLTSDRPHAYLILEADSLETAKKLCADRKPEVILFGFPLTDSNTLDFFNWMKQQGKTLLPTLVLTRQTDEDIAAHVTRSGIKDYLIKEYLTPQRLLQSIDHLLERLGLMNTVSDALSLRKRAEEVIAESRQRFCHLLECSNDLIWSIDITGNFIYLSPQFQELFGWEPNEWIGKSIVELIHVGDRSRFQKYIQQVCDATEKKELPIKFRHCRSDNNYIWVSSNVSPIKNALGDVIGVQGILRDISDRIALAYAIRDRKLVKTRLHELNKVMSGVRQELANNTKEELFNDTNYELQSSISTILGFLESLQEEVNGSLSRKKLKDSDLVKNGENHLLKLMRDILDFSKIDVGY